MKSVAAKIVLAGLVVAVSSFLLVGRAELLRASSGELLSSANQLAKISIDYPLEGSIFPPEITPPTFLWRDSDANAKRWAVQVTFADHTDTIRVEVPGEPMRVGELDPEAGPMNELLELTPQQKATRTWKPDTDTWTKIKQHSVKAPAVVTIAGFADETPQTPVSAATVTISTSVDPVGAPIFYRDVPLMLWPKTEKGSIQPLPPFAIPLIKWKLRNIGEPQSRIVMEKLPTCANCHSFSADGKTLGIDLDGPKNDKGLYAIVPVAKDMSIRNDNVIRWSSFQEDPATRSSDPSVKRFGFMSQISPDGQYVVTSIGPPGLTNSHQSSLPGFAPGIADRLYSMNFQGPPFNQVFYPTRGILAWYDRNEGALHPLPGADDPRYVQTSAFWSPDGKYLIFSRATARDSYPAGVPEAQYANDPNETQIQYDLYKIPFNSGRGGKAEPVAGASANGMSNNFPKVSADGKWIVFVQNRNGLLMRPDSQLYIVPFAGGKARLMTCNTARMNSWHSFSPNGKWVAFSSKARSAYTQLMLTHIDSNGNDSPAIIVDNTTAANRGVNIPEFVNMPQDGIARINPEATEYYRLFNQAYDLMQTNKTAEAIPVLQQAVQRDPKEPIGHYALATALSLNEREREAAEEYEKACSLNSNPPAAWYDRLAISQAMTGNFTAAIANFRKSLTIDPADAGAEESLGTVLCEAGQTEEGFQHLRKAIAMAPEFPDAHNHLGWELAKTGQTDEAVVELQRAIDLRPASVEYHVNLGYVMAQRRNFASAAVVFEKAVDLSGGRDWRCLDMLAGIYDALGRSDKAVQSERQALDLAVEQNNSELEKHLSSNLERYERDGGKLQ